MNDRDGKGAAPGLDERDAGGAGWTSGTFGGAGCRNGCALPAGAVPESFGREHGGTAPLSVTAGARDFGGLAALRESGKLLVRSWRHRVMSREWLAVINASPLLRTLVSVRPRLIVKPYRPYFSNTLGPVARLAVLRSHYDFIRMRGLAPLCLRAADTAVTVTRFFGKSGACYQLALRAVEPMEREGELVLQLVCESEVVCSIAFNFFTDAGAQMLGVGCLQGPKAADGSHARELVRAATRDLHGLRPKHLLIRLLGALGASLGCDALRLVGNANRAVRKAQRQGKVFADYDAFWLECGATQRADGDHSLVCRAPEALDPAAIPSNKRSAARHRHALLLALVRELSAVFGSGGACGCQVSAVAMESPRSPELPLVSEPVAA